eukprot:tig00021126_g18458.t1
MKRSGSLIVREGAIPWKTAWLIFLIVGFDSISVNFPRPFLPELCKSLGVREDRVGLAVGVLLGAFNAANLVSGFIIGHLSDRRGRRPALLAGLAAALLATGHLGLASSYWEALFNRLGLGLADSNTAVAKALLADLTEGPARARLLTLFGAVFALSRTLSSALAGALTLLPTPHALAARPYALPCLIAALPLLVLLAAALCALPEPPPRRLGPAQGSREASGLGAGLRRIGRSPVLMRLLLVHTLQSFANGGMLLALVLLPTLPAPAGGLGFGPLETGLSYAWNGLVGVVFQAVFFGPLLRRRGLARMYRAGTLISVAGCLLIPLAPAPLARRHPPHSTGALAGAWGVLMAANTLVGVGFMLGLPTLSSLLSFAADPAAQGLAQGTAASLASAAKALAPPLCGALFSAGAARGHPGALFLLLAAVYAASGLLALALPHRLEDSPAPPPLRPAPPRPGPPAAEADDELDEAEEGARPLLPRSSPAPERAS